MRSNHRWRRRRRRRQQHTNTLSTVHSHRRRVYFIWYWFVRAWTLLLSFVGKYVTPFIRNHSRWAFFHSSGSPDQSMLHDGVAFFSIHSERIRKLQQRPNAIFFSNTKNACQSIFIYYYRWNTVDLLLAKRIEKFRRAKRDGEIEMERRKKTRGENKMRKRWMSVFRRRQRNVLCTNQATHIRTHKRYAACHSCENVLGRS